MPMLNSKFPPFLPPSPPFFYAVLIAESECSYFNRDVDCIRRFFRRRFKYESSVYPKFTTNLRDGVREFDLDVEVAASGFSKGERKVLEEVSFLFPLFLSLWERSKC